MADELPDHVIDLAVGAGQQAAYGAALVLAASGLRTGQYIRRYIRYFIASAHVEIPAVRGRPLATDLTGQTLNIF